MRENFESLTAKFLAAKSFAVAAHRENDPSMGTKSSKRSSHLAAPHIR